MSVWTPRFHRISLRIQGYDYSQPGFYFITICTKNRECFFGEIINNFVELNEGGKAAFSCWTQIPLHYPHVSLHPFIIMPNHIHGILEITTNTTGSEKPNQNDPFKMIPHADNPIVGVQYFEPLQHDHPHGESDDSHQYFEPLQHDQSHGESDDSHQYFEPLQQDHPHGESDGFNQNYESIPKSHKGESNPDKPESAKLKNRYQHIIPGSIGSIVRGFEIGVTKWFRMNTDIHTVWQRNFYETVIRSPNDYKRISNYILNNPKNWEKDEFNEVK